MGLLRPYNVLQSCVAWGLDHEEGFQNATESVVKRRASKGDLASLEDICTVVFRNSADLKGREPIRPRTTLAEVGQIG